MTPAALSPTLQAAAPLLDVGPSLAIPLIVLLVIGLIVLIIWAAIRAHKANQERLRQLGIWAQARGFAFAAGRNSHLHTRFGRLDHFESGSERYSEQVVTGEIDITVAKGEGSGTTVRVPIWLFNFHYETYSTDSKGNRTTHHHWSGHCVLGMPVAFPYELKLRPENFLDKMAGFVGFGDINFESAEFSKRFHVAATDRKFAYDVIHPLMMEYLLRLRDIRFELDGVHLMQTSDSQLQHPADYERIIQTTVGFAEQLPGWLLRQHGMR